MYPIIPKRLDGTHLPLGQRKQLPSIRACLRLLSSAFGTNWICVCRVLLMRRTLTNCATPSWYMGSYNSRLQKSCKDERWNLAYTTTSKLFKNLRYSLIFYSDTKPFSPGEVLKSFIPFSVITLISFIKLLLTKTLRLHLTFDSKFLKLYLNTNNLIQSV